MVAELRTFAPFRLTICGIPELDEHCAAGVTHVLSILDPDMPVPPAFAGFSPHRRLALRFHDIIETRPNCLAPPQPAVLAPPPFGHALTHGFAAPPPLHSH